MVLEMNRDRKVRVLHIIPSFASGGAERVLLGYLKDFQLDDDIELYALSLGKNGGSIFDKEIEKLGLNVKYAEIDSINDRFSILRKMKAVRKAVKEIKPDIIHSHLRLVSIVTFATIFNFGLKRIHTIHTVPAIASSGKMGPFDKFCFKYMNVLPICLNKQLAHEAEKLYDIKFCEFLYNGIEINKYSGFENREKLREKLNIPGDAFVLGHVGRFVPIKNHDFIIDVFNEIQKKNKNSYLMLVGEGPETENIKNKCEKLSVKENVIFMGVRTDVNELLQIMDAYIFPSKQEGLGISLIEAQAAGLKCIASDTIPAEAFVSKNLIALPLSEPERWCDEFLNEKTFESDYSGLENFSVTEVNKKLKNIYFSKAKGV